MKYGCAGEAVDAAAYSFETRLLIALAQLKGSGHVVLACVAIKHDAVCSVRNERCAVLSSSAGPERFCGGERSQSYSNLKFDLPMGM